MKIIKLSKVGPFVFINKAQIEIIYFSIKRNNFQKSVEKIGLQHRNKTIQCFYNSNESSFDVEIDFKFQIPETYYSMPEKLMVISDIEGNINAFKNLLVNNGIVDINLNWIFGEGHLVLNGDFIDRGTFGIQCLWLIIRLEQLAAKEGGKVHFILGNHEIMNMQGNHRYCDLNYDKISRILNIKQKDLYGMSSYIGKWLITKNLIEKIGDIIFTHAGICPALANANLLLEEINNIGYKNYYKTTSNNINYNDFTELIMSLNGPYWYRNYFYEPKITQTELEFILKSFNAKFILVGHTRQNHIKRFYNGKVINTNVDHSENKTGLSEALYIEKNIFYSVNEEGEKVAI